MKKLLLLFLLLSATSSHAINQIPKTRWSKACLLALLTISGIGLVADTTARVEADILNGQVSPITAYPAYLFAGNVYPFLNDSRGPAQKTDCNYTAYLDKTLDLRTPPYKGDCPCFRGFGCACTIEACPPAQEYEQHFYSQLGCNITSICTRLVAFLGIGGWLMNKWSKA